MPFPQTPEEYDEEGVEMPLDPSEDPEILPGGENPLDADLSEDEAMAADMEELMNAAQQGEDFEAQAFFAPVPTGDDAAGMPGDEMAMSDEEKQALLAALQSMG